MEHLYYCLNEIFTVNNFLSIENCSFYKRTVARLIAIRVDDFIKIAFKLNKDTVNNKAIKDDLNALQEFYKDFFKIQRDKFGAHFQDLSLGERLTTWQEINFERVSFFSSQTLEIYNKFQPLTDFTQFNEPTVDETSKILVQNKNEDLNIEKYPNFSSDILSLTRANSGGVIHGGRVANKIGVLKSIELILNYELEIISVINNPVLRELFIKLFIIDLVSYCDNFFTRTDILPTAQQYEEGLDHYLNNADYPEGLQIIDNFKSNFKLAHYIDELRPIRNIVGGHVDTITTVASLQNTLHSFKLEKYKRFYNHVKEVLHKICYSDYGLRTFTMSPFERIYGVNKFVGLDIKSFDGLEPPESPGVWHDINEEHEYEIMFDKWSIDEDKEARDFFWNCFISSNFVERISLDEEVSSVITNTVYRKVHQYFERKLADENTTLEVKHHIVDLFVNCRSGNPYTLTEILIRTYPKDNVSRIRYLNALGKLAARDRNPTILQFCKYLFSSNSFYDKQSALLCLFRIDLASRENSTGAIDDASNDFSNYLKEVLQAHLNLFEKISYSLVLAAELYYHNGRLFTKLKEFYFDFFDVIIQSSFKSLSEPFINNEDDREKQSNIIGYFEQARFITLLALTGDFFTGKNQIQLGNNFYRVAYEGLVAFSQNDETELHNYAVVCDKCNDLNRAIEVSKYLVNINSEIPDKNYLLLNLYLKDQKYKNDFDSLKEYVLNSFNLSNNDRVAFENLKYE